MRTRFTVMDEYFSLDRIHLVKRLTQEITGWVPQVQHSPKQKALAPAWMPAPLRYPTNYGVGTATR